MKNLVAKLMLGFVLIALAVQITFIVLDALGKHQSLTTQSKAMLGITW